MSRNSAGRFAFEDEGKVLLDNLEGTRYLRVDVINEKLEAAAKIIEGPGGGMSYAGLAKHVRGYKEPTS